MAILTPNEPAQAVPANKKKHNATRNTFEPDVKRERELKPSLPLDVKPENCQTRRRGMAKVGKACDRCKLKKCKCDGRYPCQRCYKDNAICNSTKRRPVPDKPLSKEEIRVILKEHSQLTEGLQFMYLRCRSGQGWEGMPVKSDAKGRPLVHEILERMGVVDQQMDSSSAVTKQEQGSVSNESMDLGPETPVLPPTSQAAMPDSYPVAEPWKPEFSYDDTSYGFWMPCDSTLGWDRHGTNHLYLTPEMEQGYSLSNS
ncbi:hypothetical protein MMC30_003879 [Trapelia coarctata]|nr:hypothetical protein [Trapelia coarctata]